MSRPALSPSPPPAPRPWPQRGFALVNALIVVAALAAAAAGLMQIAALSRARAGLAQEALQARLALDAMESLALIALGPAEGLPAAAAPRLLRGEVGRAAGSAEIADLQGRFNVNWLANPEDSEARAAFDRLLLLIGLPAPLGAEIAAFLGPDAARIAPAYAALPVPFRPPGAAVASLDELRPVRGMTEAAFARLALHVAALQGETALNANTVSATVLAAFLPEVPPGEASAFLRQRARDPFVSAEAFAAAAVQRFGPEVEAAMLRFGVGSVWFEARLSASLGATRLGRQVILLRDPDAQSAAVIYRRPAED